MNIDSLLRHKSINNTGFDNATGNSSGRLFTKSGQSNVIRTGIRFIDRISLFHTLINMRLSHFILFAVSAFLVVNLLFAWAYYGIGAVQIGVAQEASAWEQYFECFFFSTQTITTVGYGGLHPNTLMANAVATIEAVFGWMTFAVLTGLIYGRFARPRAYLLFSKHALISPYKEGRALIFRMAPYKNTSLTDAEVLMNLTIKVNENGKKVSKFFQVKPEMSKVSSLSLNWNIVHYINEESPFYGMTESDFAEREVELLVFVKAFDEHFSNIVQQRTSYTFDEIVHGAKFNLMFRQSEDKKSTILELDKIDAYESAVLPLQAIM